MTIHGLSVSGLLWGACEATFDPAMLDDPELSWRLLVADQDVVIADRFMGEQRINVNATVGDFHVATKPCTASYQLAVVIDDSAQAITQVVRGDDLLPSAARQQLVYEALELGDPPAYYHLPLVVGEDGRRLAKRHGDTRVASYREQGVAPERILGLIGEWSGLGTRTSMELDDFVREFELAKLPRERVIFQPADHRWLLA